jgi:hypothetical protein
MKLSGRRVFFLIAAFLWVGWAGISVSVMAQNAPQAPVMTRSNVVRLANAPAAPPVPAPPAVKSPVDLFRELLSMTPAERSHFLAGRSPENRKLIMAKVREYQSLKPDVRELRLRVTELRWYLWPLMTMDPTNRAPLLARVPAADLKLIQDRLRQWDILPPDLQKQLLENEATVRYFTELQEQKERSSADISPARRGKLEAGIREWQALPERDRQNIADRFNQFFGLNDREKEASLQTLSEQERRQIEKTLRNFSELSPMQRAQCIRSFEKFAGLTIEERQQFLKNAERWKLMTPDDRQAWRDVVSRVPPFPMPPSMAMPPKPPLPAQRRNVSPAVATNGGG